MNWLLVFVPVAVALEHLAPGQSLWIFATATLAIVPLAGWLGRVTEQLAERTGEGIGGLLNATFGNAAELIIGFTALTAGLYDVVKASLAGSIIDTTGQVASEGRSDWLRGVQLLAAYLNLALVFLLAPGSESP